MFFILFLLCFYKNLEILFRILPLQISLLKCSGNVLVTMSKLPLSNIFTAKLMSCGLIAGLSGIFYERFHFFV